MQSRRKQSDKEAKWGRRFLPLYLLLCILIFAWCARHGFGKKEPFDPAGTGPGGETAAAGPTVSPAPDTDIPTVPPVPGAGIEPGTDASGEAGPLFYVSAELKEAAEREGQLTVYGSGSEAYLAAAAELFQSMYKIRVSYSRLPNSEVYTRVKSSGGDPPADVWFEAALDPVTEAAEEGFLEIYVPVTLRANAEIPSESKTAAAHPGVTQTEEDSTSGPPGPGAVVKESRFRDPEGYWYGMSYDPYAFLANTEVLSRNHAAVPESFADLGNEAYRMLLTWPDPNITPAGRRLVAALLQMKGKEAGLSLLRSLHRNTGALGETGDEAVRLAARGERGVGIGLLSDCISAMRSEAISSDHLIPVLPAEGAPYEVLAAAIFRNASHPNAAKLWTEFVLSDVCRELQEENGVYRIPVQAFPAAELAGPDLTAPDLMEPGETGRAVPGRSISGTIGVPEEVRDFALDIGNLTEFDFEDAKEHTSEYVNAYYTVLIQ